MRYKLCLIVNFIFLNSFIFSQVRKFTPEPEKFLKEVQSTISEVDKSRAKVFVNTFESYWLGDFFSPDLKAHVYATANLMGEKGLRVNPDYLSYFNSLLYLSQAGLNVKTLKIGKVHWIKHLINYLKKEYLSF